MALDAIFPPRMRALRARIVSYDALVPLSRAIRIASVDPPAFSLLPYRHPLVQAAVTEAKFNDARHAQDALGRIFADFLQALAPNEPYVLVPVPLSRQRKRQRGYNQAERICRAARLPLETALLARARDTPPQTGLGGKARRENLKDAFAARKPPDPYTLYIVVDDVITTGTTLAAAAAALRAAGAQRILPVALAHSP